MPISKTDRAGWREMGDSGGEKVALMKGGGHFMAET